MPACRMRSAKSVGNQALRAGRSPPIPGDASRARFVAMANGYPQRSRLPGIDSHQSLGPRLHRRESGAARRQAGRHRRNRRHGHPMHAAGGTTGCAPSTACTSAAPVPDRHPVPPCGLGDRPTRCNTVSPRWNSLRTPSRAGRMRWCSAPMSSSSGARGALPTHGGYLFSITWIYSTDDETAD